MSIPITAMDDFLTAQYPKHMGKKQWKELTQDLNEYCVVQQYFTKGKFGVESGPYLQWMVNTGTVDTARPTGLFATQDYEIAEGLKKTRVDWHHYENTMVWDIDEEGFQGGPDELLKVLDVRTHMMEMNTIDYMEKSLWNVPTSISQDPLTAYGIPYWIVKSSTAAFGFNGGNHANFSGGPAGLDSSLYPKWKNGTFTYAKVDQTDFVKKVCEALDKCYFKSPRSYAELDGGAPSHSLHTTYAVKQTCQDLLTNSNDNLKMDLGQYRGTPLIRGVPLEWANILDNTAYSTYNDTKNPIYGIDWTNFRMFFKKGAEKRYEYIKDPTMARVRKTVMDGYYQFVCTDRRKHFVGYDSTL